jgi:dihydrofolate synthase/folylpolyglutamate synthase
MDFSTAHQYLLDLTNYEATPAGMAMGRYLDLGRMRHALARLGNPHADLRCAHLAGTKGKGSTAAMIAAIAGAAGRRVGLYTSPHLVHVCERFRLNGTPMSEEEFAAGVRQLQPLIEAMRATPDGPPTYFEALTLLAFDWFSLEEAELVVLETGLGGRLDATNVVTPLVTALTTIAYDHQAELGETLTAIAGEKAGILKAQVPVVSAPQLPEAAALIARLAGWFESPLYRVGEELSVEGYDPFTITGRLAVYDDLTTPLLGAHQRINAAVAVGVAECLREAGEPITPAAIREGLAAVEWPGRLQILQEQPLLLLDGAHDPASMTALLAALDVHYPDRPRRFVLGFSREKAWEEMLAQLAPTATECLLTAAPSPRAVAPEELAHAAEALGVPSTVRPDVPAALEDVLARADPDDLICVTGSLFVVGEALKWWAGR